MKFFIPTLLDFLRRQDILMFIRNSSHCFFPHTFVQTLCTFSICCHLVIAYHICSVILHGIHQDTMSCLWLLQLVVNANRKRQQNYVNQESDCYMNEIVSTK